MSVLHRIPHESERDALVLNALAAGSVDSFTLPPVIAATKRRPHPAPVISDQGNHIMARTIFVRPQAYGWAVIRDDGVPLATFRSPADAIVFGRDCAQRNHAKLVIEAPDGEEQFAEWYPANPVSPIRESTAAQRAQNDAPL